MKKYTLEVLNKMMPRGGGNLDLYGTSITALPEGLTVGGYLDLRRTPITALPEGLTVGGNLNLYGTPITALPEGLTVGGGLDLRRTPITALPEGLTVGSYVYADFPVGKVKRLTDGDYVPNKYLYADGILTHVKRKRKDGIYTYYYGKIKNQNVISDGENYAHCESFKKGVRDLGYKRAERCGKEQYKDYTLDTVLDFEDARNMYRIITGACEAGTDRFISSLKKVKDSYSVGEIIALTEGQYGSATFKEFFTKGAEKNA